MPPVDLIPGQKLDTGGTGNSVPVGSMVEARVFTEMVDAFVPSLFVLLLHWAGIKLSKTDLQLTEKEKTTVTPLLQKCMDTIMIKFNNPWNALAVTMGIIYGSKIMEKGGAEIINRAFVASGKPIPKKTTDADVKTVITKPDETPNAGQGQTEAQKESTAKARFLSAKASLRSANWLPSEDDIQTARRERKVSREKAIDILTNAKARSIVEGREVPIR